MTQASVHCARLICAPLADFLEILPSDLENGSDNLTQIQCNGAFDIFLQFDPFPSPGSYNFDDMRRCFSELRQELDLRLCKSRSRMKFLQGATRGSVICLVSATVGVVISAVAIASHALVALVACPFFPVCLPTDASKKELAHLAQLEAAAKGTYVLHNDLDAIGRLVVRHSRVTSFLSDFDWKGAGTGMHPIQEVMKQLRKTHSNSLQQLTDLDEHPCLCFAAINLARALLLGEIHLY